MAKGVVGRLKVRVLPDSSEFNRDLKKMLDRAEAKYELHIPVALDLLKKSVAEVKREISGIDARIKTKVEESGLVHDRKKIEDKLGDPIKPPVKPDMDTGKAKALLAWFTRPRSLTVNVELRGVQKAATALAALSGGRVLKDFSTSIKNAMVNLDRSVPKVMAVTAAIGSLSSVALASTSSLIGVAGGLASIVPAAAALPGMLLGAASGAAVLILALKDAKTVLADMGPAFKTIQERVSGAFWEQAAKPIRNLATDALPALRQGLVGVSTQMGKTVAELARGFDQAAKSGQIGRMLDSVAAGVAKARPGVVSLTGAFTTLGTVGASYLPRLGQWFTDLTQRFEAYIAKAADSGKVNQWIESGIAGLKQLGGILNNLGGLLAGIHSAAKAAGAGGLATLNASLSKISAAINSPAFQSGLTAIFAGARKGAEGLSAALGPIGNALSALAPVIENVLGRIGQVVGQAVSAIANGLADPAISAGLNALIDGLSSMVTSLIPAVGPLAQVIGALGPVIGELAANIGNVLGAAIQAFAPALTQVLNAAQPLIPVLGSALASAIKVLGELVSNHLAGFVTFSGILAGGFGAVKALAGVDSMVNKFKEFETGLSAAKKGAELFQDGLGKIWSFSGRIVSGLGSIAKQAVTLGAEFTKTAAQAAISAAKTAASWVASSAKTAAAFLIQKGAMIASAVASGVLKAATIAMTAVQAALNAVMALNPFVLVAVAVAALIAAIVLLWNNCEGFRNAVIAVWEAIKTAVQTVVTWFTSTIVPALQTVWEAITVGVQAVKDWFVNTWNSIASFFSGLWEGIKTVVSTAIQAVYDFIAVRVEAVKTFWQIAWQWVSSIFSAVWNGISSFVSNAITNVSNTISNVINWIKNYWTVSWNIIKSAVSNSWNAIKNAVSNGVNGVVSFVSSLPGKIKSFFSNAGSWLLDAGKKIISGLIDGIKNMFSSVKDTLGNLTSKLTSWKGPESTDRKLLVGAGELIIQGLIRGMESQYGQVKASLQSLTSQIGLSVPEPKVAKFGQPRVKDWAEDNEATFATPFGGNSGQTGTVNQYFPNVHDPQAAALAAARGILGTPLNIGSPQMAGGLA